MNMRHAALGSIAAFAAAVSLAAVTFDPQTGTGFVGKGDVQTAFGWNNPQFQNNYSGVTFTFTAEEEYAAVCTFVTGEGTRGEKTHNVRHTRSIDVLGTLAYDARQRNQITGFNLTGFSSRVTEGGSVPAVGGACMGNPGHEGTWSSVEQTGGAMGLYAVHNSVSRLIWGSAL